MNIEVPPLDEEKLKEAAKEAAMKGALAEIKEYYEGYNSPYRKKVKEELEKQEFSFPVTLPDIIGQINETLTAEINKIAANSISNTFLPKVQQNLTRTEPVIKFTEILQKFISHHEGEYDDYEVSVEESRHGWLNVKLSFKDQTTELTLHKDHSSKEQKQYKILGLPRANERGAYDDYMTLYKDGSFKIPFTKDVLSNDFILFCARVMLSESLIVMDETNFDEDMFEKDECHC